MNDSDKASGFSAGSIGLIVVVAVLTAVVAHALETFFLGDANAVVSAAAASAVAVVVAIGVSKR